MTTLAEIESAADTLSHADQELLLQHLRMKLRSSVALRSEPATLARERVAWPDYEARLRSIYGDQPMPSMVLEERELAS